MLGLGSEREPVNILRTRALVEQVHQMFIVERVDRSEMIISNLGDSPKAYLMLFNALNNPSISISGIWPKVLDTLSKVYFYS